METIESQYLAFMYGLQRKFREMFPNDFSHFNFSFQNWVWSKHWLTPKSILRQALEDKTRRFKNEPPPTLEEEQEAAAQAARAAEEAAARDSYSDAFMAQFGVDRHGNSLSGRRRRSPITQHNDSSSGRS